MFVLNLHKSVSPEASTRGDTIHFQSGIISNSEPNGHSKLSLIVREELKVNFAFLPVAIDTPPVGYSEFTEEPILKILARRS